MRIRPTLVAPLLALALLGLACSDDEGSTPEVTSTTTTEVVDVIEATPPTPSPTAEIKDATVNTSGNTDIGFVLADAEGLTLYLLLDDPPGTSTCVDACAQAWPPLIVEGELTVGSGLDPDQFGVIVRPDGTRQAAVKDRPLYRFAGDSEPGDTAGQGLNGIWFASDWVGNPVQPDSATAE